jgi:hypothetical protein
MISALSSVWNLPEDGCYTLFTGGWWKICANWREGWVLILVVHGLGEKIRTNWRVVLIPVARVSGGNLAWIFPALDHLH